jgi:hypothetical protein
MPEKGSVSAVLVGGFIGLSIESAANISRIDGGRFRTNLAQPIEEVA